MIKIGGTDHLGRVYCLYHVVGKKHKGIYIQPRLTKKNLDKKHICVSCNQLLHANVAITEGLYSPIADKDGVLIKN